jgi:uncharacterized protein YlaI
MKKVVKCRICEEEVDKNTIGLNKKFISRSLTHFLCINCL